MPDETVELFEEFGRRGHEPLLRRANGTVRFDIANGHHATWSLEIHEGDLKVSHRARRADCTVHADAEVFDQIASGHLNATAAVLRGAIAVEGDPELLLMFQRLLPGPKEQHHEAIR